MTRALLLLVLVAACKREAKDVGATEADCVAYRNKMFSFFPAEEQKAMGGIGMDKPTPKEIEICRTRMKSDEIQCAVKAATIDEALACKSAVDDRTTELKRTPDECKAFADHMMKLAEKNEAGQAVGPPLTPTMAKMAGRECDRGMTKKRYDCVMKAEIPMGLMQCPP